jgi:HCOMODA/2-hydroxy-3-carboxy-muconic semialdehyde decarboxylase
MLVNRKERGTELARVLAAHTTALMRGHGDVVVGSNIQNVVWRSYYTEINARMLAQAIAIGGGPIMYLSAEEAALTDVSMQRVEARPWKLWKQKALGR